jgi:hypothetical protein
MLLWDRVSDPVAARGAAALRCPLSTNRAVNRN